jgi:hypothetical protein
MSEVQTHIIQPDITFTKEVRQEKDLEKFIIFYLKNQASHKEATAKTIFKNLKDSGLLNPGYKLNERRIGRGVLSDRSWFIGTKRYDPQTKQELVFWRYDHG